MRAAQRRRAGQRQFGAGGEEGGGAGEVVEGCDCYAGYFLAGGGEEEGVEEGDGLGDAEGFEVFFEAVGGGELCEASGERVSLGAWNEGIT